ncbi:unnamed protein product, partial [Nesidiocoris tenuis]
MKRACRGGGGGYLGRAEGRLIRVAPTLSATASYLEAWGHLFPAYLSCALRTTTFPYLQGSTTRHRKVLCTLRSR